MMVIFDKDANFTANFCPERARDWVTTVTAGALFKEQNNAGLEE
jgi:hypothetical protein